MFRPRHAYRSPTTSRYKGKAKGCPVFNNLIEINSHMVEQHDECLECLAKLKNRTELYKTLADNNKPSNNVIKSLQRLSSSASNNRLKTCLQFLIIKVNEKSITTPSAAHPTTTVLTDGGASPKTTLLDATTKDASTTNPMDSNLSTKTNTLTTRHLTKRQKSHYQNRQQQLTEKQKHDQLASPPHDQVSSTQDSQVGPTQDDHDCQTSPPTLTATRIDEQPIINDESNLKSLEDDVVSPTIDKVDEERTDYVCAQTTQSSPSINCLSSTTSTATNTTTISTSPKRILDIHESDNNLATINSDNQLSATNLDSKNQLSNRTNSHSTSTATTTLTTQIRLSPTTKRRRMQNSLSSDQESSSVASWSLASYAAASPPSPLSSASATSPVSSISASSCSSYCSSSSCLSSPRQSPSPSPLSSPDMSNKLGGHKLRLNEAKIRKIQRKPILFDDLYYFEEQPSIASTPTSSGCSPGQHSNTTQNSDVNSIRSLGPYAMNTANHMFQAPPTFVNNLKPCNLPTKSHEPPPASNPPVTSKIEMINCAICGIKDKPPNISKVYGQNSCILCSKFFAAFLKQPQQLFCAQDGDCFMTFDSRCQACWIKICLQKFNIDEEHRKIGYKYSPKLLSSPNVSLITIDTSIPS